MKSAFKKLKRDEALKLTMTQMSKKCKIYHYHSVQRSNSTNPPYRPVIRTQLMNESLIRQIDIKFGLPFRLGEKVARGA